MRSLFAFLALACAPCVASALMSIRMNEPVNSLPVNYGISGPFSVTVLDGGRPKAGVLVDFSSGSCPGFTGPNIGALTDANGRASSPSMGGVSSQPGTCEATAWLSSDPTVSATFRIVIYRGADVMITPFSVESYFGETFEIPVQITDRLGRTLGGNTISVVPDGVDSEVITEGLLFKTDSEGRYTIRGKNRSNTPGSYRLRLNFNSENNSPPHVIQMTQKVRPPSPPPSGGNGSGTVAIASASGAVTRVRAYQEHPNAPPCSISNARRIEPGSSSNPDIAALPADVRQVGFAVAFEIDCRPNATPPIVRIELPEDLPARGSIYTYGNTFLTETKFWKPFYTRVIDRRTLETTMIDGQGADTNASPFPDGIIRVFAAFGVGKTFHDMWWGGPEQNGWGLSYAQHGTAIFGALFVYDDTGAPTWHLVQGADGFFAPTSRRGAGLRYLPTGSPYFAYDPARFAVGPDIGTVSLEEFGAGGMSQLTISALEGQVFKPIFTVPVMRHEFGRPGSATYPDVSDMWWAGPSQNGWGLAIHQRDSVLFSVWYTYDAAGNRTWFAMPDGTWTAPDTYAGRVYRTRSSAWLTGSYDASQFKATDVGSFELRFAGDNVTFTYDVEGHRGSHVLSRLSF
ncbi:hypothetical protein [Usitatibacter rugosus]|nr:hypothetical protein [Usitatibacter rugosus]